MWLVVAVVVVALAVAVPVLIRMVQDVLHHLLTDRFPVHTKGGVLVTGTSTGIGHSIAVDLAKATKLTVFATVRKKEDFSRFSAHNLPNLIPVILDVASAESIEKCLEAVKAHLQERSLPFVGLVNNAGLGHGIPVELYPLAEARHVFNVNFFGVLEITQKFLPLLRASHGRLVMISSVAGTNSFPMTSIYSASKFALEALSDALRKEVRHHQVAVSVMEPAYVHSELMHNSHLMSAQVLKDHNVDLDEAARLYPKCFDEKRQAVRRQRERSSAAQPEVVSHAVIHALTVEQPYPRYRLANAMGLPAWALVWIMWGLPDSVKDYLWVLM